MRKTKSSLGYRLRSFLVAPAISAVLMAASGAVQADNRFGVHVVDEQGAPMAGVAVCIGMHGNYKQFGAMFTDGDGNAIVDVPNVPLVVTVSQNRFTGVRLIEPARGFNLIKQVKLIEGVPGPRCSAGSALADAPSIPAIRVKAIDIDDAGSSTRLMPNLDGEPNSYRVSNNSDFAGAKWNNYSDTISLSRSLSAEKSIFLQFRHYSGTSKGWLEARSDVVTVRLPAR